MAFIIPTINKPVWDAGSYNLRVARPIACPMGVVVPYAKHINQGFQEPLSNAFRPAMREPSARPSNVSAGRLC